ncbi:MAG: hypothetical protein ACI4DP_13250 [Candidatus Ornithomonoglobus sp.]
MEKYLERAAEVIKIECEKHSGRCEDCIFCNKSGYCKLSDTFPDEWDI